MVARVFAARNPKVTSGVVYIDSQTELTYFNPAERTARKTLRYLFSDCAPHSRFHREPITLLMPSLSQI